MEPSITVEVFEARPDQAWPEALRELIRFLRFSAPVACAECGKRRKTHWTMLVSFVAHTFPTHGFDLQQSGTAHDAMAPVCRAHLLAPDLKSDPAHQGANDAAPPV